jgi:hypothetical protein
VLSAIGPFTIIPALKPVSYDVEKDIVPLTTVWRSAEVLAVRPTLPPPQAALPHAVLPPLAADEDSPLRLTVRPSDRTLATLGR